MGDLRVPWSTKVDLKYGSRITLYTFRLSSQKRIVVLRKTVKVILLLEATRNNLPVLKVLEVSSPISCLSTLSVLKSKQNCTESRRTHKTGKVVPYLLCVSCTILYRLLFRFHLRQQSSTFYGRLSRTGIITSTTF